MYISVSIPYRWFYSECELLAAKVHVDPRIVPWRHGIYQRICSYWRTFFCEMWWKNHGSRFHPVISQVLQLRCWFSSLTWESRGTMTPCPRTFWWSTFSCLVSRMTMDAKPLVRGIPSKRLYFTENSMYHHVSMCNWFHYISLSYLAMVEFKLLMTRELDVLDSRWLYCSWRAAFEVNPRRRAQWSTDGRGHSNSSPKGPWPKTSKDQWRPWKSVKISVKISVKTWHF